MFDCVRKAVDMVLASEVIFSGWGSFSFGTNASGPLYTGLHAVSVCTTVHEESSQYLYNSDINKNYTFP